MPMPAYRGVFHDSINRESEIIPDSTYRISVCLKRYFNDMRALCYVLISRKKTVKWLEKKIKNLFSVNGDFVLTSRGHLLPSSERLGLLNADDIVEVVPNEIVNELKNKMKCAHAVTNNGSNVENDSIFSYDENDSAVDKNQIISTTITFGQKDTLKELELEQRIIQNNQYQNEIDCIRASSNSTAAADVVDVESEYKTTEKCDLGTSAKKKKFSFEQKDSSKVELEKSVENDISNNSNIHYLSTDEVQDELEVMKKNALALLDSSFNIFSNRSENSNIGGTRKRKRVRRKRTQVLLPEEMSENNIESDNFRDTLPHENEINSVTESSKTIPLAILHNEEICNRKPRIVQSIVD